MSELDLCREFDRRVVSDDPADLDWARQHASTCVECGARLAAFAELDAAARDWRAASPEPPPSLEARILRSVREHPRRVPERPARTLDRARRVGPWLAAAAGIVLAVGLLVRSEVFWKAPTPPPSSLLVEQALQEAEVAEAAHARAIARLEEAAAPVLARAGDPTLAPRDAALLLAYRDRLRFLDRTVAEVDGFLAENPNHAKARTVLLAAYVEKTEVLREVLALQPAVGGRS